MWTHKYSPSLRSLQIIQSDLQDLNPELFQPIPQLQVLSLSRNRLSLPALSMLKLTDNSLMVINEVVFQTWTCQVILSPAPVLILALSCASFAALYHFLRQQLASWPSSMTSRRGRGELLITVMPLSPTALRMRPGFTSGLWGRTELETLPAPLSFKSLSLHHIGIVLTITTKSPSGYDHNNRHRDCSYNQLPGGAVRCRSRGRESAERLKVEVDGWCFPEVQLLIWWCSTFFHPISVPHSHLTLLKK